MPLRFAMRDIGLFERSVRFARPFRFGVVTISEASITVTASASRTEPKGSPTFSATTSAWWTAANTELSRRRPESAATQAVSGEIRP